MIKNYKKFLESVDNFNGLHTEYYDSIGSVEEIDFPHRQLEELLEDDRDIAQVGDTVLAKFFPAGTFKLTNLQDSGRDGLGVSDDKQGIWYGINDAHFVVLWDNYMDEKDAFLPTRTPDRDKQNI